MKLLILSCPASFCLFSQFLDAYDYLNNPPPDFLPKAAVITVSGLAGLVLARKGKVCLFSLLVCGVWSMVEHSSGLNTSETVAKACVTEKSFLVKEGELLIAVRSWLRPDRAGLDRLMIHFSLFTILENLVWDYFFFRISVSPAFNCYNYLVCISFLSNCSKYLALYRF